MPVTFKLKIRHQGASQIESYVGKDGSVVTEKIAGALEETVFDAEGKMIAERTLEATERNVFLSAMLFQRLVSRTPMDENYMTGMNERGKPVMHKADNDYVRDAWVASYGTSKITAKELREKGIEFLKFNDRTEVKKIYAEFLKLLGNRKVSTGAEALQKFTITNTHERFPMLEYGEYRHDGSIKSGEHFKHGVKNGFSIQAPVGMERLTRQEFEETAFNIPTKDLMENGKRWQTGLIKAGSLKNVTRILKGKKKVSFRKMCEVAKEYGL